MDGDTAMCGIVAMEELSGLDGLVSRLLGIGCGCSMPDPDTNELEIIEFDRRSHAKVYPMGSHSVDAAPDE